MAQYRIGSVTVLKNSPIVVGTNTEFLTNVSPGDLFCLADQPLWYEIASVNSDTELSLSQPLNGDSATNTAYAIHRDFSARTKLALLCYGDINTASLLSLNLTRLDQRARGGAIIDGTFLNTFTLNKGLLTGQPPEFSGLHINRGELPRISLLWREDSISYWDFSEQKVARISTLEHVGKLAVGQAAGTNNLDVAGDAGISGDLTIGGNLTVLGDTVTLNAKELTVEDPVLAVGVGGDGAAPYLGLQAARKDDSTYMVWAEKLKRWSLLISADNLKTTVKADIEFKTAFGNLSGNADTASTLQTPRKISLAGDGSGEITFDGGSDVTLSLTLANTLHSGGTFTKVKTDTKGRIVKGESLASMDVTTALGFVPLDAARFTGENILQKITQVDGVNSGLDADLLRGKVVSINADPDAIPLRDKQGTIAGSITGNAATATQLAIPRKITISGDGSAETVFSGSQDVSASLTLAPSGVTAGTFSNLTVDGKGRITAARALSSADIEAALGFLPSDEPYLNGDYTVNGRLTVTKGLIVEGETVTLNAKELEVEDAFITIAKGSTGLQPISGIRIDRGVKDELPISSNIIWDAAKNCFRLSEGDETAGAATPADIDFGTATGNLRGVADQATKLQNARRIAGLAFDGTSDIAPTTDNIREGGNQYFTVARVRDSFTPGNGITIDKSSGVISANVTAGVNRINGAQGDIWFTTDWVNGLPELLEEERNKMTALIQQEIHRLRAEIIPVGTFRLTYAREPDSGYLTLNGALLNRSDFPQLLEYAQRKGLIIENDGDRFNYRGLFTYGPDGPGGSTFRLPSIVGLHLRMFDTNGEYDGGRQFGSFQDDGVKVHNHPVTVHAAGNHNHGAYIHPVGDHSHSFTQTNYGNEIAHHLASGRARFQTGHTYNHAGSGTGGAGNHGHGVDIHHAGEHAHSASAEHNSGGIHENRVKNVTVLPTIKF